MTEIHIINTDILCTLLQVPGKSSGYETVRKEFRSLLGKEEITLLLPIAVIYEVGNIITQLINQERGTQIEASARNLAAYIKQAIEIPSLFSLAFSSNEEEKANMMKWCDSFPVHAMGGTGMRALSLIELHNRQCEFNPLARVRIWSYEGDLAAYDRLPSDALT